MLTSVRRGPRPRDRPVESDDLERLLLEVGHDLRDRHQQVIHQTEFLAFTSLTAASHLVMFSPGRSSAIAPPWMRKIASLSQAVPCDSRM